MGDTYALFRCRTRFVPAPPSRGILSDPPATMGTMTADRLFRAPRNALGPPPSRDAGRSGQERILIGRFVWPGRAEIMPVVAVWIGEDRVLVAWPLDVPSDRRRRTWLPVGDVAARVTVR